MNVRICLRAARSSIIRNSQFHIRNCAWGRSSAGRALQWHCRGQGFDPPRLHHFMQSTDAFDHVRFCALHTNLYSGSCVERSRLRRRNRRATSRPGEPRTRYCRIPCSEKCRSGSEHAGQILPIVCQPNSERCLPDKRPETGTQASQFAGKTAKITGNRSPYCASGNDYTLADPNRFSEFSTNQ